MTKLIMSLLLIPVYIFIGVCWFAVTMFIAIRGAVDMVVDYILDTRK